MRLEQDQCVVDYRRAWDQSWRNERRIDFSPGQEAEIKKHAILIAVLGEIARLSLVRQIENERRSEPENDAP